MKTVGRTIEILAVILVWKVALHVYFPGVF